VTPFTEERSNRKFSRVSELFIIISLFWLDRTGTLCGYGRVEAERMNDLRP